ncbi:MAG: aspartate/glutamate racemase family protein, partial [Clostridia bacterium]|nr:aspartate/glutamate racemase family protein [Clostridia bacterium]
GTAATLDMKLYDNALKAKGVKFVTPSEEGKKSLMRIIYDVVKAGKPVEECRADFEAVIAEGLKNGADYFILGCTELPIAADELHLPYLFADPTYALARAAIHFCGYETV